MTKRERLTDPPQPGDYLTDGERLFEIVGEPDSDGNYYLMDCALPIKPSLEPEKVTTHELWKEYWVVRQDEEA